MEECGLWKKCALFKLSGVSASSFKFFSQVPKIFLKMKKTLFSQGSKAFSFLLVENQIFEEFEKNFKALKDVFLVLVYKIITWRSKNIYINVVSNDISGAMQWNLSESEVVNLWFLWLNFMCSLIFSFRYTHSIFQSIFHLSYITEIIWSENHKK